MSCEISLCAHGCNLRGEIVHQSPRTLVVRMLSPYEGLTTGIHIAAICFRPDIRRFDGEYGQMRAKEMLQELYCLGQHVESNRDMLRSALDVVQHEIREMTGRMMSDQAFLEARSILRRQRKEGLLDNRAYQQALGVLRKQRDAWNREKRRLLEAFFAENFPMHVCSDSRELLLDSLESGRRLLA